MTAGAYQRLPHEPLLGLRKPGVALPTPGQARLGWGPAEVLRYRLDPEAYVVDRLGWQPWRGTQEAPGQADVLDAYTRALEAQLEAPGAACQNRIRIAAGHTVGKTKIAAAVVNHFFDCYPPAICYTFAPTWEQIHDLLWKE